MNLFLDLQEIGINVDFLFFDRFLYAKWLNKIPDLKAYEKKNYTLSRKKKIKSEDFAESSKSWKENKIILLLKLFFSKGLISEI